MGRNSYNFFKEPKLRLAVRYVRAGFSYHRAFLKTGIAPSTIKKYHYKYKEVQFPTSNVTRKLKRENSSTNDHNVNQIFTPNQEIALIECFRNVQSLFHGISEKECRVLAYQMVVKEDMRIPDDWKNGMATLEWLKSFRRRYPLLHFESPLRCSRWFGQGRNIVWEKKTVSKFYDDLEELLKNIPDYRDGSRIFSLDETYISADLSKKEVTRQDSKRDLITTCCFICADGTSLPPVTIVPHKIFEQYKCTEISPGALTLSAHRGRLTSELFHDVIYHFVKHSKSSIDNPSILIMDTDTSHLCISAFELAKLSCIHFLTIHTHLSKLLQPLEDLFSLLHNHYYSTRKSWMDNNTENEKYFDLFENKQFDFGKAFGKAYVRTMTPENISNAFKKCGISPFDRDLLTGKNYLSCVVRYYPCYDCRARDYRSTNVRPFTQNTVNTKDKEEGTSEISKADAAELVAGSSASAPEPILKTNEAVHSDGTKMSQKDKTAELEKLMRRMIRTVARLTKEKKTEDEVWEHLKMDCGGVNCKRLWERMRSLTLKKLKRLLDVDDRIELVPPVARMTITDWLLYDLVIVHEKLDVIDRSQRKDSKVLTNLFALVQGFQIEGLSGDALAEAWTSATVHYNSKGHQCSPMLMQRRWYQLKELTRHKMYKFWFAYRGNERLLQIAKQDQPTELQRTIALRYPQIITQPFPEWEERIGMKLVIMPEEFEIKLRNKSLTKPSDENAPDVEIIERKIDTIVLADSDSEFYDEENSRESNATPPNTEVNIENDKTVTPVITNVKTEPEDYENIDITDNFEEPKDRFQEGIERLTEKDRILSAISDVTETVNPQVVPENVDCVMPVITNVMGAVNVQTHNAIQNIFNEDAVGQSDGIIENDAVLDGETLKVGDDEYNKKYDIKTDDTKHNTESQETILIDDDDDEIIPSKNLVQEKTSDENNEPETVLVNDSEIVKAEIDSIAPEEENVDGDIQCQDLRQTECPVKIEPDLVSQSMDMANEIISELNFSDNGIEFADDGIEYTEEQNDQNDSPTETQNKENANENEGTPKFDLKLLMNPVVYTTKLDQMSAYKNRSIFDTIDKEELVSKITIESKPIITKPVNIQEVNKDLSTVNKVDYEVEVKAETQDSLEIDDDLFHNESLAESMNLVVDDSKKVKLSSKLLQKPKVRNYHPIQLCKNPDFNTRLKRLTVGFYSSPRNRIFLNACKPMTIDISKAFESKLVNGTMYLKTNEEDIKKEEVENVQETTVSILPSAVPVQSLMNNESADVDAILQEELRKRTLNKNKIISLPNISIVRKINQQLLMAEVAPIPSVEKLDPVIQENVQQIDEKLPGTANQIIKSTYDTPNNVPATAQSVPDTSIKSDQASNTSNAPKQKKKPERTKLPSWVTKTYHYDYTKCDSLLTLDTVYKMLNALDPDNAELPLMKKTKKHQAAKIITNEQVVTKNVIIANESPHLPKKGKYCCWARFRIIKMSNSAVRNIRHKCVNTSCKCCCKELLRQKEIENEIKILEGMQSSSDTISKSIETVVQQSRDMSMGSNSLVRIVNTAPTESVANSMSPEKNNDASQGNLHENVQTTLSEPHEHVGENVTIDLDANEAEVPSLVEIQSPKPKIRVHAAIPISQDFVPEPKTPKKMRTQRVPIARNWAPVAPKTAVISLKHKNPNKGTRPSKYTIYSKKSNDNSEPKCSCQPNVAVDRTSSTLLIDGTNDCPQHTKTRISKEKRIYLSRKHMSTTENPFYVGKNKILLTNIKPEAPPFDPMNLTLPNGVQIVMLPDRTITYVIKPDAVVTPDEMAAMPAILNALMPQVGATGITLLMQKNATDITDIINLDDDTDPQQVDTTLDHQNLENSNVEYKSNEEISTIAHPNSLQIDDNSETIRGVDNQTESQIEINQESCSTEVNSLSEIVENTTDGEELLANETVVNKDNTATDNAVMEQPESSTETDLAENVEKFNAENKESDAHVEAGSVKNSDVIDPRTTESNNASANLSRNLLSDLMEISGIVEEDVAPLPQDQAITEILPQSVELNDSGLLPNDSDVVPVLPILLPNKEKRHCITAQVNENTYELNPITSFAGLKYACANNGLFFKLDINSGIIVPINVCIQKSSKESTPKKISPTEVIDLTDEQGNTINEEKNAQEPSNSDLPNGSPTNFSNFEHPMSLEKPRIFKNLLIKPKEAAKPSSVLKPVSVDAMKQSILKKLSNNLKPLKILDKRTNVNLLKKQCGILKKQQLLSNKIDTKINMLDSDTPMEEEYLLDESSDGSDDEPLAKIAKKMRSQDDDDQTEGTQEQIPEQSDFLPQSESQSDTETASLNEGVNFEVVNDSTQDISDQVPKNDVQPVPTQLVMTRRALNQPILLENAFLSSNEADDEDSQDDCILGV